MKKNYNAMLNPLFYATLWAAMQLVCDAFKLREHLTV